MSDPNRMSFRFRQPIGFCFNTIGVSDGQTNGHSGMHFSLPSRDLIADSYESAVQAHLYDGTRNREYPEHAKQNPEQAFGFVRSGQAIGCVARAMVRQCGESLPAALLFEKLALCATCVR